MKYCKQCFHTLCNIKKKYKNSSRKIFIYVFSGQCLKPGRMRDCPAGAVTATAKRWVFKCGKYLPMYQQIDLCFTLTVSLLHSRSLFHSSFFYTAEADVLVYRYPCTHFTILHSRFNSLQTDVFALRSIRQQMSQPTDLCIHSSLFYTTAVKAADGWIHSSLCCTPSDASIYL